MLNKGNPQRSTATVVDKQAVEADDRAGLGK